MPKRKAGGTFLEKMLREIARKELARRERAERRAPPGPESRFKAGLEAILSENPLVTGRRIGFYEENPAERTVFFSVVLEGGKGVWIYDGEIRRFKELLDTDNIAVGAASNPEAALYVLAERAGRHVIYVIAAGVVFPE